MKHIVPGQVFLFACIITTTLTCAGAHFPWSESNIKIIKPTLLEVQTLNPRYDRIHSHVVVRRITRPTVANLDYAAYEANMMLYQPQEPVEVLSRSPNLDQVFGKTLVSIVSGIEQTPLSPKERNQPMAFSPMVDYLARINSAWASGLEDVRAAVRTENWGLPPNIQYTYQKVSSAWIHNNQNQAPQMWVRIEFAPWARLFTDMPDQNADGFCEIYAQVRADLIPNQAFEKLAQDYLTRELSQAEVTSWINELASYWYPSYNTDVVVVDGCRPWPDDSVEPNVIEELGQWNAKASFVIRGKPQGIVLYNVFVIDDMPAACEQKQKVLHKREELVDIQVNAQTQKLVQQIKEELAQHGSGSYPKWIKQLEFQHRALRRALDERPKEIKTIIGKDGFLFFRNSLRYVLSGDLRKQPQEKNPFATIVSFKDYLTLRGVDFLLVPVPTKLEVYPDRFLDLKDGPLPIIHPFARKFFSELSKASVEVVDLLPVFLDQRKMDAQAGQRLYQAQDTHWTDRGLRIAARVLAERVKKYPWFQKLDTPKLQTQLKQIHLSKYGDLYSRLAENEKKQFKPQRLLVHQVLTNEEKPLEDDPLSPVVVLGDSFTGVFQRIDCHYAGLSAHLAHQLSIPIDLVMSWGGGPNVRQKLLRRSEASLAQKKLVIWVFAARDLYDYWEPWEPIKSGFNQTP